MFAGLSDADNGYSCPVPSTERRSEQLALLVDQVQDYAIFMLDP